MAKLISKTYGEALFELAIEENRMDEFLEEAQLALRVIRENPEFSAMMNHPRIDQEEKVRVVENVFGASLSREITGLLRIIVQKDRYKETEDILSWFIEQVKQEKGIGQAFVTSALPLSDAQKKQIEEKLLATTSYKQMEMVYETDESLIGGLRIRIGDRVVDSSISNKLSDLKRELLKVQIS
ncbi:MAG: ATP synthase F1 subunit delta [Lachnospiraceae bacterium]|nr:ATP synthase F1 subunit delta [Lachnospiraceae bacterium]MCR5338748.1 ATP synthase F1 subunit delta [Lachnospiraceae bacterium]